MTTILLQTTRSNQITVVFDGKTLYSREVKPSQMSLGNLFSTWWRKNLETSLRNYSKRVQLTLWQQIAILWNRIDVKDFINIFLNFITFLAIFFIIHFHNSPWVHSLLLTSICCFSIPKGTRGQKMYDEWKDFGLYGVENETDFT